MPQNLIVKKGLNIKLVGEANKLLSDLPRSKKYALKPCEFHGVTPKLVVKEGTPINAGEPIFVSKDDNRIQFVSPVSGTLSVVERGEKRKILKVVIDAKDSDDYIKHEIPSTLSAQKLKELLLKSGCWPFIKQRPYDVIANPDDTPKAIFVSAYATAPLAACPDFFLKEDLAFFQAGMEAISCLTPGKLHLSVANDSSLSDIKKTHIHRVSGPHPGGNVSVQIEKINPISQGEKVWVITPQDVVVVGKLIKLGIVDVTRVLALAGSEVEKPRYLKVKAGAMISDITGNLKQNVRIISGDVLTGSKVASDDFLGYYHNLVTVIPEGNQYRMFGWLPFKDNNIHSFHGTSLYKLFSKPVAPNTNLNGEERAIVVTGKMEQVMPMDIYPMQLIKECLANNIEKMEQLGIYEVAPEDFALIDYISTSKIEAQDIIRKGLDLIMKEVG